MAPRSDGLSFHADDQLEAVNDAIVARVVAMGDDSGAHDPLGMPNPRTLVANATAYGLSVLSQPESQPPTVPLLLMSHEPGQV